MRWGRRPNLVFVVTAFAAILSGQTAPRAEDNAALRARAESAFIQWKAATTETAKEEFRRTQGPLDARFLIAINDNGEDLQKKGDYPGAIARFEFCRSLAEPSNNLFIATALQLIGGTERLQGNYVAAEEHYRTALDYAGKPGGERRIPFIKNNLANIYVRQARFAEGLSMLKAVIEYNDAHGFRLEAAPYQNSAIVYGLTGDFARSLENFLVALRMYEEKGDTAKVALTHYNIGILQTKQGNFEAAVGEYEVSLSLSEKAGDRTQMALTLSDLGQSRDRQGRTREALESMNRALALAKEIGYLPAYDDVLLNLGNFHLNHDELPLAAARYEEALSVATGLNDGHNRAIALRGLAFTARRRGDFDSLSRYAAEALETAHAIGDIDGQWQGEALAGMAWRARHETAKSRDAYNRAITQVERARGLVGGGDVEKQRFFEQAVYPYQELAGLEFEAGNPMPSLQAAEQARARTLLEILQAGPSQIDRQMTETERREEVRLRAEIAVLNSRVAGAKPAEQQQISKARDEAWHNWELFLAALYVRHPELRTWRGEAPAISEHDLAAALPEPNSAAVEFLSARDETLLFVITMDPATHKPRVAAHRIAIGRAELSRRAEQYRAKLESRDPSFREEARALYTLLLGPAATELKGRTHIALLPDGPLWQLPFQTLIAPSGRYWIEDAVISWAPSITFLRDQHNRPAAPRAFAKDLLAMADPARPDAAAIPVLRDQARRIAALYDPARTLLETGVQAGEAFFKSDAAAARVIHIAAHGTVDPANALHSRILLAPSPKDAPANSAEDGWLEAWELMRMNLPAELVILSACETGRGTAAAGEGLIGLTWALFVSGVQSAIVSQWRVESESTTALMVNLHRRLRHGDRPADALRGSILTLMKKDPYRHPMYWGAFISAGR